MSESRRGRLLTAFAVLFGLLAVSNFAKPFGLEGGDTGFVFLGHRLSGLANAVVGPLFGVFLAIYATGIWRMRAYAVPLARIYAAYVIVNLLLFSVFGPQPEGAGIAWVLFGIVYALLGIGVSVGAAIVLAGRRSELT